MDFPAHWPRPKLWVIRLQKRLERIFPAIIASIIPFALPVTVAGLVIGNVTGERIFTRGVIFGIVWLAIAPYLITLAYYTIGSFFDKNRDKFLCDDKTITNFQHQMLRDLESPNHGYSNPHGAEQQWKPDRNQQGEFQHGATPICSFSIAHGVSPLHSRQSR